MQKKKKRYIVILLLSLIVAILAEVLFVCSTSASVNYEMQNAVVIYPSSEYRYVLSGYENTGDTFEPTNDDPMIIFNNINHTVESIYIEFSEPLASNTHFQVFYSTAENDFSETYSLRMELEEGATKIAVDMPYIECENLRLDINGTFSVENLILSEKDYRWYVTFENINFSLLRVIILFVLSLLITILIYRYFIKADINCCITRTEFIYCLSMFAFYFLWAVSKEFNYAPDEYMRYEVTQFLYENNRLPAFEETINAYWGFSYAHNPTMLCNVLAYIPMKIASLFSTNERVLLLAARMVSVLCGTGVVVFSVLTAKRIFNKHIKWIYIIFISCIPQFVFLTSYVNNDIIALFGASMIFYSWTASLDKTWNYRLLILLSLGISVCTTSYYNSYGWILCSIVFYIASYFMKAGYSVKDFVKRSSVVCGIVIGLSCYFFVRHYILYNDFLGFEIIDYYNQLYGQNAGKQTLMEQGVSIYHMLFNMGWIESTYKSFIETFGYMSVFPQDHVYYIYTLIFIIGFISATILLMRLVTKKSESLNKINTLYISCIAFTIIIPIMLNIWHSYNSDFQPQGRYSYPAILGISFVIAKGFSFLIERIKEKEYQYMCVGVFSAILITISISEYFVTYLPS